MIKKVVLFLLCLTSIRCFGQNLISNGSFEEASKCPATPFDFDYMVGWRTFRGTPDHCAACNRGITFGVPHNSNGIRSTFWGGAYVGLALFGVDNSISPSIDYQADEAIYTQLIQPLQTGKAYRLSFCLSLSDSARFSTDSLFCSFSSESPVKAKEIKQIAGQWYQFRECIDYSCPINFEAKGRWNEVVLQFTAKRNYRYLAIGLPRSHYSKKQYQNDIAKPRQPLRLDKWAQMSAYYYLDNVQLVEVGK